MTEMDERLRNDLERIKYFHAQTQHPPEAAWYGLDRPLKRAFDIPDVMPVLVQMHHSIDCYLHTPPCYTSHKGALLVGTKYYQKLYVEHYGKPTYATGSPYVHYRRMNGVDILPDAKGTLAFPAHSTHHVHSRYDVERFADLLLALPDSLQPVGVCLYWMDMLNGKLEPFLKRNIPVYTAGHIFDPDFHVRFYDILRRYRYSTANAAMGSHIVLALEMGLPYFRLGGRYMMEDVTGGDPNWPGGAQPEDAFSSKLAAEIERLTFDLEPHHTATDIAISPELAAKVSEAHGCDGPVDADLTRKIIFYAFLKRHPWGQQLERLMAAQPTILTREAYEPLFARDPAGLEAMRFIERHPAVLQPPTMEEILAVIPQNLDIGMGKVEGWRI